MLVTNCLFCLKEKIIIFILFYKQILHFNKQNEPILLSSGQSSVSSDTVASSTKWTRPPLPALDAKKDKVIFQQVDLDFYVGRCCCCCHFDPLFELLGFLLSNFCKGCHLFGPSQILSFKKKKYIFYVFIYFKGKRLLGSNL